MKGNPVLEQYLGLWEAQATDEALQTRGGGGVVTALVAHMIETGKINKALLVGSSSEPPWAKPVLATSVAEVYLAAGSKYQLVPYGNLTRDLDENSTVVGLPCQIRALAGKPVGLKIGLFCGMNLSWRGIRYLLRQMKIDIHEVEAVDYRAPGGGFLVRLRDGKIVRHGQYSQLAYFFSHKCCIRCTDHTNQYADISVGDRRRGWSNVIVRTEKGMASFQNVLVSDRVAARRLDLETFLTAVTTPLVQKEYLGGYIRDPLIRVRRGWIEYLPLRVLNAVGDWITRRHRKRSTRILQNWTKRVGCQ